MKVYGKEFGKVFLIVLGTVVLCAVAVGIYFMENKTAPEAAGATGAVRLNFDHAIMLDGTRLNVALADTDQTRQQGLSGQTSLTDIEGMMFDFSNSERRRPGFWMKEMQFPLDIIWIKDNVVIDIARDVPAPSTGTELSKLPLYFPPTEIDKVIEVNAGWCARHNIGNGSKLTIGK
jgi:uncharacterized membrane protein (UPF0127 family)